MIVSLCGIGFGACGREAPPVLGLRLENPAGPVHMSDRVLSAPEGATFKLRLFGTELNGSWPWVAFAAGASAGAVGDAPDPCALEPNRRGSWFQVTGPFAADEAYSGLATVEVRRQGASSSSSRLRLLPPPPVRAERRGVGVRRPGQAAGQRGLGSAGGPHPGLGARGAGRDAASGGGAAEDGAAEPAVAGPRGALRAAQLRLRGGEAGRQAPGAHPEEGELPDVLPALPLRPGTRRPRRRPLPRAGHRRLRRLRQRLPGLPAGRAGPPRAMLRLR
uniref:Metal transporter CNNM1/2/4 immunoglobulin-like domain-containing protein n=1 Tax=Gasterosteus aculeatus TaxID=69293 RepID=G3NAC6_GASAC